MNKKELAGQVAIKSGLNKSQSEAAINAVISCIGEALKNDEKVSLSGLGTFAVKTRASRIGRNPATGETIEIPATRVPEFKASTVLKAALKD